MSREQPQDGAPEFQKLFHPSFKTIFTHYILAGSIGQDFYDLAKLSMSDSLRELSVNETGDETIPMEMILRD